MTKMMAIFLVLFSSVSFAQETPNWMKYHSLIEIASNPVEFMGFKKKYPEHFYSTEMDNFHSAIVSTETFLYVGATICSADDYRLKFISRSVQQCLKINGVIMCSKLEPVYPKTNLDPCRPKFE